MIRDCQRANKTRSEIIRECEGKLAELHATRKDLVKCVQEYGIQLIWHKYQQGYVSRKIDINCQPVKINHKTGDCYVLVPCLDSTYYCFREYHNIDCKDFVEWLIKKRH